MKNILYLCINKHNYFLDDIKDIDIDNFFILSSRKRILYKLCYIICHNFSLYGKWRKNIDKYDLIILGENSLYNETVKYIKKKNKHAKVVVCFLNKITPSYLNILSFKDVDAFYTFDKNDAKTYNINYNPQYFSKDLKLKDNKCEFDIMFCGRDKGRYKKLKTLEEEFKKRNLKTYFKIVFNNHKLISYQAYLEILSKSRCILDICANNQIGFSLRVMESIFLNKKLITNNLDIKNYPIYNKNNIFLIGEDDLNNLEKFLKTSYKKINQKYLDYYDYHAWVMRFFDSKGE